MISDQKKMDDLIAKLEPAMTEAISKSREVSKLVDGLAEIGFKIEIGFIEILKPISQPESPQAIQPEVQNGVVKFATLSLFDKDWAKALRIKLDDD